MYNHIWAEAICKTFNSYTKDFTNHLKHITTMIKTRVSYNLTVIISSQDIMTLTA